MTNSEIVEIFLGRQPDFVRRTNSDGSAHIAIWATLQNTRMNNAHTGIWFSRDFVRILEIPKGMFVQYHVDRHGSHPFRTS